MDSNAVKTIRPRPTLLSLIRPAIGMKLSDVHLNILLVWGNFFNLLFYFL